MLEYSGDQGHCVTHGLVVPAVYPCTPVRCGESRDQSSVVTLSTGVPLSTLPTGAPPGDLKWDVTQIFRVSRRATAGGSGERRPYPYWHPSSMCLRSPLPAET